MSATISVPNGKVSAVYVDSNGKEWTEPLSYTRFNLADSSDTISAYSEELGSDVTYGKATIANRIAGVASGLASLTDGCSYKNSKVSYDVKLEGV